MRSQKEEILQIIRESDRHMTADEIFLACRAKGIHLSLATVYRNLGIMADDHVLRRVPVSGKPDCFDKTVAVHGHKVCDICGEVSDIDVGDLRSELERRLGMPVTDYELCLHFICPSCLKAAGQPAQG